MFNGTGAEPGEQGLKPNAAEPPWGQPRRAIGCIHTIIGSFTVARAGAALQLRVGDPVFEGDIVETGADSTVAIQFSDGTVFKLSACARMVLSEFARDGARSGPARFVLSKGAIAFMAGKTARGGFSIDTPIARIQGSRGGGIVSLAVAALTFAALETVRADDQPVIDDERVELPHGTFELVTKEQVPQVIVVDDPRKSVVLQKLGSTVDINRVTNSPERMDDLGQISRETFRIFQQGQRDLFIQHEQRAGLGGSSEPISDFQNFEFSTAALVSPANLITSDPSVAPRVETIPVAVAAAYIPEAPPAVVQTTIVDNFPIIPISSSAPAITLATVGQQTFIDTSALDLFSPVNGAVSATAPNNAPLTYEIVGGTADSSQNGYDQSLTGAYGALYLNSTTGAYTFVPDNTAINALTAPAAANFTLTASDGNSSAEQTVTFMLDGADDAPTLQPVTGATYPNDAEPSGFAALAVASNPLAPVTGTLIGADVDLPAQTLTYGIVDGTSGGVLGEVAYDVSKTGAYGTLYVNSATGDYEFVPNEAAIKALPATAETVIENFTVTVSDGSLSAEQAFTVTVNGANDAPVITGVTTGSVTEDDTGHSLASGQLNATDPDLDATQTWTVVGGTPSIAADYQFRADSFSVTRANGAINGFPDDFNSPPSSPTYSFIAGGFDVADGKLLMDSDNAVPFIGVGANSTPIIGQTAVVRTNVDDTDPTLGLKKSTQFTITGVFDLVSPDSPREAYGIRATDRLLNDVVFPEGTTLARAGDDTFELVVRGNLFGQDLIALRQVNFATNTVTNFQSFLLAPPEEADQISLTFDHAENSPYLVASFQYLSDGVPIGPPIFFSQPAPIFGTAPESTTTENWTLAQIISYAPAQSDSFLSGMYGSLNINQAGAWTYLLDNTRLATQSLAEGQHATDSFTVQVTDQYGASDIKVINIDVVGTNDAPVITSGPAAVAVSEEGLANGVPDNSPAGLDTVDSATAGGTITATDVDSDPLHMTLGIPTEQLTSGGTAIAWTLDETDETGHTLVGKVGETPIITVTITDAGAYTVTLNGPIDHPNTNQEDNKTFDVPVAISDGHTSIATTLSVTVEDDSPKATQVEVPISSTDSMTNVMLILDLSGSMSLSSGLTGPEGQNLTRLDVAKAAVTELLEQYADRGNVMVRIVWFSDSASANSSVNGSAWLNVADAKTVINDLSLDLDDPSAGGLTNYDAALLTAMQAFTADGKLSGPGTQNVSYFISDGAPTANTDWPADVDGPLTGLDPILTQNGIQPSEQTAWESFLTTNNIVSFALGIPTVTTPTNLDPIAFDPATGTQTADTPIIVTDLSQLANALVITVPALTGSVLTGAGGTASNSFGGDGGFVQSITVDGVTYTFDPTANGGEGAITTSGGGSFAYDPTTKTLTVDTDTNAVGGEFAMDMTTGAFTFQPPANFNSETIDYVLADNDGDTAGSTLHFSVASEQLPAGIAGEPINLALSDPGASETIPINVTVSGLPSGWTLNEGTRLDDGSWAVQTTDVGSLTVTTSADFVGAAVLNVTETWTNPDGTTGIKIIADNVEAYAPGSPIFAWSGDDTLTGSSGPDLFVFAQPIGYDVIYSFDASHDQIDLIGYAGFASFDDVKSHLTADAHGNAVITLADGQSITIDGVAADSLSASNFVFDQTPVTDNAGAMTIGNGALLPLSGVINNTGTIALNSAGHATTLELIQHGVTLQGGGQLTLSDSDANLISGAAPGITFTNADNTISGAGQLGDGQTTLVNHGTIVATGAYALIIDTGSNEVINTGKLESTGSGGLFVNSDVANAGLLWAHGGDITINGAVSGAGGALITGDATLEFAAATSINVTFVGENDYGTLVLDNPATYTGQIFGFAGTGLESSDLINLKGIAFDAGTSWAYYDNIGVNTGGILTIYETVNGVTTAVDSLTFGDGEFTTANFKLTSDGDGGTLIADPPADPATTAIDNGQTAGVDGGAGVDNLAGLLENLGMHLAGDPDCLGNDASGSFVFNATFAQTSTIGPDVAQTIAQLEQTVFQTVSDMLAEAAQASPETTGPTAECVPVDGSEHHKSSTDFLLHG